MARKRYKPEEIAAKLRQVDVLVSQGQNMVDAIRGQNRPSTEGDIVGARPPNISLRACLCAASTAVLLFFQIFPYGINQGAHLRRAI
jgi:hypothetical protein